LLVALDHLDEVIALIRSSDTPDEARGELMARYDLTEVQATAILDMQLRRLAALERQKIAAEHADLVVLITELDAVLADPKKLDRLLADELKAVKAGHASPRRSRISEPGVAEDDELADAALPELEAQPVTVYVTAAGYLKPVPVRRQSKPHTHPRDPVAAVLRTTTEHTLLLIDAEGNGYRLAVADIPVTTMRQRGTALAQLLGEPADAPIVGALVLEDDVETVLTVSARGQVKRTERAEYEGRTRTMIAAGVKDSDRLVAAAACGDADQLLVAHSGGQVVRFAAADVRPMGRAATGVAGMDVPKDAEVIAVTVVPGGAPDGEVLTLGADGSAKRAPLDDYPVKGRGGKGVQTGVAPSAWCGIATPLHVPAGDGYAVVQPEDAPVSKRSGKARDLGIQVSGRVVAEQG
jgi:DNA gyrase subunit A